VIATIAFVVMIALTLFNYSFGHNASGQTISDFLVGQRRRILTAVGMEFALLICSYAAILLFARRER
jgi:hypothetical protein